MKEKQFKTLIGCLRNISKVISVASILIFAAIIINGL